MKTKFFAFLSLVLLSLSLASCGGVKVDKSKTITINFYVDYNYAAEGNIYHTCSVYLNAKITDVPENPTENIFNDFPNFIGWSTYQIINDTKDLWNFDKDIVQTTYSSLSLYGIWTE